MDLINQNVKHIKYGPGSITAEKDHAIWVQFQGEAGTKEFLFPEAFEKYLKACNPEVEQYTLEALQTKKEQIKLEKAQKREKYETELKAAQIEKKQGRTSHSKKTPVMKAKKEA